MAIKNGTTWHLKLVHKYQEWVPIKIIGAQNDRSKDVSHDHNPKKHREKPALDSQ